jgi:hypothetical protein
LSETYSQVDRSTIALIISIIALLFSTAKWIYDIRVNQTNRGSRRRRWRAPDIRVEPLEGQTNCFITRGGYLLFLISFRIYNDNDQVPVSIQESQLQSKIGRKWHDTNLYDVPQAVIFPSLLRNNLPLTLKPDERQDFYEIFALDELIPSIRIKTRLKLKDGNGKIIMCQETFNYRVDERPVFDILFRTYEA